MQSYKELKVWQRAFAFVDTAYDLASLLPQSETYGLSSQLKRASVSIASNIAEGRSRKSDKDFARFIEIALGSAFEVETLILIMQKRYPKVNDNCSAPLAFIEEIQKMAHVLYNTLRAKG